MVGNYYAFLPVRDCKNSIGEAISSLQDQSHPPVRIIVVDDGSTDGTSDILSDLSDDYPNYIQIISTGNKTRDYGRLVKLWNMCISDDCDYHMISAGDIIFERDYAKIILSEMDKDLSVVVASGEYERVKSRAPHGAGRFVRQSFFFDNYEKYPEIVGYESEILWRARLQKYKTPVFENARFIHTDKLGGQHGFVGFGFGMRALGYHPLYVLGRAIYARNLSMLWHYITYKPQKSGYYSTFPDEFRALVRQSQYAMMKQKIRDACRL